MKDRYLKILAVWLFLLACQMFSVFLQLRGLGGIVSHSMADIPMGAVLTSACYEIWLARLEIKR